RRVADPRRGRRVESVAAGRPSRPELPTRASQVPRSARGTGGRGGQGGRGDRRAPAGPPGRLSRSTGTVRDDPEALTRVRLATLEDPCSPHCARGGVLPGSAHVTPRTEEHTRDVTPQAQQQPGGPHGSLEREPPQDGDLRLARL